ncbi:hypothetical protein [Methanosphaera sp.]|uniref:hypothetical protein n=1 Tax=Methanosphaera sp. TaxID=2666342 RepID=UPI0025FBB90F|nr:hypothetical protein [Methanosphaera sp.]MEE3418973.1 hypothetical protein [Methanosphaera sp.]
MAEFEEINEIEETELDTIETEGNVEEIEEYLDEDDEKLPFAKAEVVRLMKQHLDDDKMIRERVKVEMNKFLGDVLANVCKQLNEYPYSTVEYEMLKESTYPYTNIERINEEKIRILKHLDAIKADCDALSMDVKATLKINDKPNQEDEEDDLF